MIWVALVAAGGLALFSVRSLAFALARAVDTHPEPLRARTVERDDTCTRSQLLLFMVEIAMSLGIALTIVGLTVAAALPGRLLVGALLAQVAVVGALLAPPTTTQLGSVRVRPAALALGVAQLAHVAFFLKALQAML